MLFLHLQFYHVRVMATGGNAGLSEVIIKVGYNKVTVSCRATRVAFEIESDVHTFDGVHCRSYKW